MSEWFELIVELVDQGNSSRYVQRQDILVGNVVEVFDQCPQAVAMCNNDGFLAALNRRHDGLVPVGEKSGNGVLEAF